MQLELLSLSTFMVHHIGNQGPIHDMTDYWAAATLFELYFLTKKFDRACKAAFQMQALFNEPWKVKSTIQNVHIIKDQASEPRIITEAKG